VHNQTQASIMVEKIEIHQKLNLLIDHHPCLANISIVTDSITRHADCKVFFIWSFWKFGHVLIQYVPRKITCIDEDIDALLNTMSLRLNHITHNMAPIPIRNICLSFGFIPYTQPPIMCLLLLLSKYI
jgi:hypothetical protein